MAIDDPWFNRSLPRVCVIGAGSTGIAIAKALKDAHVPFVCYERGQSVGGNWVFKNPNGLSSAYRSLHINTSRDRMQFTCFPMPREYPDFAHHTLLARYFDDFAEHFGLKRFIEFERAVIRVEPRPDGTYRVLLANGSSDLFDAVVVANGHHWDPRFPEPRFAGKFDGIEMHSHHYLEPTEPHMLVGKRVVVVGMGNSAMDIASELGHPGVADKVYLSARRGAWVLPKYILGRPIDQPRLKILGLLPWKTRVALARKIVETTVGRMEDYGLPKPDHDPGHAHPTISSEILTRLGSGDVIPKPNIKAFEGKRVRFMDDSVVEADVVIYCTGYNVTFPFFAKHVVSAPNNELPLFKHAFRPDMPGLFFAGLCQPLGAIMPIAEVQGQWLAEYLCGLYALPSVDEMQTDVEREREAMRARYVPSARHTMQVDFETYLEELAVERLQGRKRARARGQRLSIPPRACHG